WLCPPVSVQMFLPKTTLLRRSPVVPLSSQNANVPSRADGPSTASRPLPDEFFSSINTLNETSGPVAGVYQTVKLSTLQLYSGSEQCAASGPLGPAAGAP